MSEREAGRPEHPYTDRFTNEWAWRFEDAFGRLASASGDDGEFFARLAQVWEALAEHKQEMADAWVTFVARKAVDAVREVQPPACWSDRLASEECAGSALAERPAPADDRQAVDGDGSVGPAPGPGPGEGAEAALRALDRLAQQAGDPQEPPSLGVS